MSEHLMMFGVGVFIGFVVIVYLKLLESNPIETIFWTLWMWGSVSIMWYFGRMLL